jgi:hypothetical protein
MQSRDRKRMKNGGCQLTDYLNCPVLPYDYLNFFLELKHRLGWEGLIEGGVDGWFSHPSKNKLFLLPLKGISC